MYLGHNYYRCPTENRNKSTHFLEELQQRTTDGSSLTQARHRALHQALIFEIAWLRPPLPHPVSYPGLHPNAA